MEFEFKYVPAKFNGLLSEIRTVLPYLHEINHADNGDRQTEILLDCIKTVNADNLEYFALSLKSREMELILDILKNPVPPQTANILKSILKLKFRKKLFYLCWIMLQYDYENAGLLDALELLSERMREEHPGEFDKSIFSKIGNKEISLAKAAKLLLIEEKSDIRSFCRKYSIIENSSLALKLRELFFLECGKDGFLNNKDMLARHLNGDDVRSAAMVYSCYLKELAITDYSDQINSLILTRWGTSQDDESFWQHIDDEIKLKFLAWQDLKKIEAHFGKGSTRFRLWAGYFDKMAGVGTDEAGGFLLMDFGRFIAVDIKDEDGCSFLCNKEYFSEQYIHYIETKELEASDWKFIPGHIVEARDLVIEGIKSEMYRVGYDRAQILYLREILKVELDPAVRAKYI